MRVPILIQQFTHLVCILIALASLSETYPRLSFLLFGQDRKNTKRESTRKTNKQYTRQDIPLDRKVMVSLLTSGIKLLTLLGSPCCRPLLLPLLRWSRKLLASSGL